MADRQDQILNFITDHNIMDCIFVTYGNGINKISEMYEYIFKSQT